MSSWADDEVSDDDRDMNTPEEILQDNLLKGSDRGSGGAPQRERRDLGSAGGVGDGGRPDGRRPGERRQGGHNGDMNGSRGMDKRDGGDTYDRPSRKALTDADFPTTGPFVAYVGNLNFRTTAQTLGEYFYSAGCDVEGVVIAEDEDGRPRGFGHITFASVESLKKAMEGNDTELEGRSIRVDVDQKRGGGGGGFGGRDGGRGGGDRGGERRYREEPPSGPADELDRWGRGEKRAPRAGSERVERAVPAPREKKERPKLNLAPRTVPASEVGAPVGGSSIFGDAKPRDESLYVKKEEPKRERRQPREKKEGEEGKPKNERKERSGSQGEPIQRGVKPGAEGRVHKNKDKEGNKDAAVKKGPPKEQKDGGDKAKGAAAAKPAKKDKADGLTDEQRFEQAQNAMSGLSTTAAEPAKKKVGNVFAAAFDSDSD